MERKLLRALYDCFYTHPRFDEQENEVEECHKALIEVLAKPERSWCCGSSMPRIISKRRPLWIVL